MLVCLCSSLTVQAGEAEHADLLGDVVPGPRGAQRLQLHLQLIPHQQNTVCHGLHIALPTEEEEKRVRQARKEKDTRQETSTKAGMCGVASRKPENT